MKTIIALLLTSWMAFADVSVTRTVLPEYDDDGRLSVELSIEITGPIPTALVITEEAPPGWEIADATWQPLGAALAPRRRANAWSWLLDPLSVPVAPGKVIYKARASSSAPLAPEALQGNGKWLQTTVEILQETNDATAWNSDWDQLDLAVESGWNLLSLPFTIVTWPSFEITGRYRPMIFDGDNLQLVGPRLEAGQGFWFHATRAPDVATLYGPRNEEPPTFSAGWSLIGVSADTPVDALAGRQPVVAWSWDRESKTFRRVATMRRGLGYWVFAD